MKYEDIVKYRKSPTLVLAGPGAGKTYLLADRVKYLLESGVDKYSITVLTFGKDASKHMWSELINPKGDFKLKSADLPHISTMHSLGFEIVQERPRKVNLLKTNLKVQSSNLVKQLLFRDAAYRANLTREDGIDAMKAKQFGNLADDQLATINQGYLQIMSRCNRIDFDDQILFACQILKEDQDLLEKYQQQATNLLVDEYQDINSAQFELIELLSRENRNGLFVVGDDAQSIYGFRGSTPDFILRFQKDFPDAITPPLSSSRRCPKIIMTEAIKILKKYYREWTGPVELAYHAEDNKPPYVWHLTSEVAEAEMVAKLSRHYVTEEKEVLILAPKKDFFLNISESLTNMDVPHAVPSGFLEERIIRVKHFLDWIEDKDDNFKTRLVIEDLMNTGAAKVAGAKRTKRTTKKTLDYRILVEKSIANLWNSVDKKNSLYSALISRDYKEKTVDKIEESLDSLLESYKDFKRQMKGEFVKQFAIVSGLWVDPSRFSKDYYTLLDLIQKKQPTGKGFVQLLTMRKAKGLQADVVIIVGLESDIFPNPRNDISEESRLFYVSMTRTKRDLFLFHSYKRPRNVSFGTDLIEKSRSIFLDELGIKSIFIKRK